MFQTSSKHHQLSQVGGEMMNNPINNNSKMFEEACQIFTQSSWTFPSHYPSRTAAFIDYLDTYGGCDIAVVDQLVNDDDAELLVELTCWILDRMSDNGVFSNPLYTTHNPVPSATIPLKSLQETLDLQDQINGSFKLGYRFRMQTVIERLGINLGAIPANEHYVAPVLALNVIESLDYGRVNSIHFLWILRSRTDWSSSDQFREAFHQSPWLTYKEEMLMKVKNGTITSKLHPMRAVLNRLLELIFFKTYSTVPGSNPPINVPKNDHTTRHGSYHSFTQDPILLSFDRKASTHEVLSWVGFDTSNPNHTPLYLSPSRSIDAKLLLPLEMVIKRILGWLLFCLSDFEGSYNYRCNELCTQLFSTGYLYSQLSLRVRDYDRTLNAGTDLAHHHNVVKIKKYLDQVYYTKKDSHHSALDDAPPGGFFLAQIHITPLSSLKLLSFVTQMTSQSNLLYIGHHYIYEEKASSLKKALKVAKKNLAMMINEGNTLQGIIKQRCDNVNDPLNNNDVIDPKKEDDEGKGNEEGDNDNKDNNDNPMFSASSLSHLLAQQTQLNLDITQTELDIELLTTQRRHYSELAHQAFQIYEYAYSRTGFSFLFPTQLKSLFCLADAKNDDLLFIRLKRCGLNRENFMTYEIKDYKKHFSTLGQYTVLGVENFTHNLNFNESNPFCDDDYYTNHIGSDGLTCLTRSVKFTQSHIDTGVKYCKDGNVNLVKEDHQTLSEKTNDNVKEDLNYSILFNFSPYYDTLLYDHYSNAALSTTEWGSVIDGIFNIGVPEALESLAKLTEQNNLSTWLKFPSEGNYMGERILECPVFEPKLLQAYVKLKPPLHWHPAALAKAQNAEGGNSTVWHYVVDSPLSDDECIEVLESYWEMYSHTPHYKSTFNPSKFIQKSHQKSSNGIQSTKNQTNGNVTTSSASKTTTSSNNEPKPRPTAATTRGVELIEYSYFVDCCSTALKNSMMQSCWGRTREKTVNWMSKHLISHDVITKSIVPTCQREGGPSFLSGLDQFMRNLNTPVTNEITSAGVGGRSAYHRWRSRKAIATTAYAIAKALFPLQTHITTMMNHDFLALARLSIYSGSPEVFHYIWSKIFIGLGDLGSDPGALGFVSQVTIDAMIAITDHRDLINLNSLMSMYYSDVGGVLSGDEINIGIKNCLKDHRDNHPEKYQNNKNTNTVLELDDNHLIEDNTPLVMEEGSAVKTPAKLQRSVVNKKATTTTTTTSNNIDDLIRTDQQSRKYIPHYSLPLATAPLGQNLMGPRASLQYLHTFNEPEFLPHALLRAIDNYHHSTHYNQIYASNDHYERFYINFDHYYHDFKRDQVKGHHQPGDVNLPLNNNNTTYNTNNIKNGSLSLHNHPLSLLLTPDIISNPPVTRVNHDFPSNHCILRSDKPSPIYWIEDRLFENPDAADSKWPFGPITGQNAFSYEQFLSFTSQHPNMRENRGRLGFNLKNMPMTADPSGTFSINPLSRPIISPKQQVTGKDQFNFNPMPSCHNENLSTGDANGEVYYEGVQRWTKDLLPFLPEESYTPQGLSSSQLSLRNDNVDFTPDTPEDGLSASVILGNDNYLETISSQSKMSTPSFRTESQKYQQSKIISTQVERDTALLLPLWTSYHSMGYNKHWSHLYPEVKPGLSTQTSQLITSLNIDKTNPSLFFSRYSPFDPDLYHHLCDKSSSTNKGRGTNQDNKSDFHTDDIYPSFAKYHSDMTNLLFNPLLLHPQLYEPQFHDFSTTLLDHQGDINDALNHQSKSGAYELHHEKLIPYQQFSQLINALNDNQPGSSNNSFDYYSNQFESPIQYDLTSKQYISFLQHGIGSEHHLASSTFCPCDRPENVVYGSSTELQTVNNVMFDFFKWYLHTTSIDRVHKSPILMLLSTFFLSFKSVSLLNTFILSLAEIKMESCLIRDVLNELMIGADIKSIKGGIPNQSVIPHQLNDNLSPLQLDSNRLKQRLSRLDTGTAKRVSMSNECDIAYSRVGGENLNDQPTGSNRLCLWVNAHEMQRAFIRKLALCSGTLDYHLESIVIKKKDDEGAQIINSLQNEVSDHKKPHKHHVIATPFEVTYNCNVTLPLLSFFIQNLHNSTVSAAQGEDEYFVQGENQFIVDVRMKVMAEITSFLYDNAIQLFQILPFIPTSLLYKFQLFDPHFSTTIPSQYADEERSRMYNIFGSNLNKASFGIGNQLVMQSQRDQSSLKFHHQFGLENKTDFFPFHFDRPLLDNIKTSAPHLDLLDVWLSKQKDFFIKQYHREQQQQEQQQQISSSINLDKSRHKTYLIELFTPYKQLSQLYNYAKQYQSKLGQAFNKHTIITPTNFLTNFHSLSLFDQHASYLWKRYITTLNHYPIHFNCNVVIGATPIAYGMIGYSSMKSTLRLLALDKTLQPGLIFKTIFNRNLALTPLEVKFAQQWAEIHNIKFPTGYSSAELANSLIEFKSKQHDEIETVIQPNGISSTAPSSPPAIFSEYLSDYIISTLPKGSHNGEDNNDVHHIDPLCLKYPHSLITGGKTFSELITTTDVELIHSIPVPFVHENRYVNGASLLIQRYANVFSGTCFDKMENERSEEKQQNTSLMSPDQLILYFQTNLQHDNRLKNYLNSLQYTNHLLALEQWEQEQYLDEYFSTDSWAKTIAKSLGIASVIGLGAYSTYKWFGNDIKKWISDTKEE